jgi:hypothetical protein
MNDFLQICNITSSASKPICYTWYNIFLVSFYLWLYVYTVLIRNDSRVSLWAWTNKEKSLGSRIIYNLATTEIRRVFYDFTFIKEKEQHSNHRYHVTSFSIRKRKFVYELCIDKRSIRVLSRVFFCLFLIWWASCKKFIIQTGICQ